MVASAPFRLTDVSDPVPVQIVRARRDDPRLARTLVEVDLHTFSEPTFSDFTATAFQHFGGIFLLLAGDDVIGTCACMRSWDAPDQALLLSMGILPGFRGRGLGQAFVRGVMALLHDDGFSSVALLVGASNHRAIRVYQDVGFEIDHAHQGHGVLRMRAALASSVQDDPPALDLDTSVVPKGAAARASASGFEGAPALTP